MARVYSVTPRRRLGFFSRLNVTMTLVLINVAVFILFTILLSINEGFIDWIALKPANIFAGKYVWTIITSMFMHGGVFHIFANMVSLFFIGTLVERLIGPKRYLWFYLLSGIFASLLFILIAFISGSGFDVYAVGASGAIFGLLGFLMIITPNLPVYLMFIPIPIKMKYAAPGILVVLWLISGIASVPIGNVAHLGGFIAGIFYALYLKKNYRNRTRMISRRFS